MTRRRSGWLSGDAVLSIGTGAATLLVLASLFLIVGDVVWHGAGTVSWTFLSAAPEHGMTGGGIFPAIFGTVALVVLMTVAVVPIGVATAIYLSEFAERGSRTAAAVRTAVRNLAGVPSIVFGLFGLGFFIQFVGRGADGLFFENRKLFGQPALMWSALTMAILTLPVVIVAVEEALQAIPNDHRVASLALGGSKFQTILYVVLPQAAPGVLTGAILAVSRGAGEVAPILFTGAAYFLPTLPKAPTEQFMDLGYHIYVMATQSPDVDATAPILYGTVLVLLALTFLLNGAAIAVRYRMRRRAPAVA